MIKYIKMIKQGAIKWKKKKNYYKKNYRGIKRTI